MRYANTTSGAVTFSGNTLGLAKQSGKNLPGTLDSIGAFVTLNTNSQAGTYPPGTTLNWSNNSSAAVLRLPANSTVLYAELIWAGSAQIAANTNAAGNVLNYLNRPVRLILPNGSTNSVNPDPATASLVTNGTAAIFYVRSANVTALVQSAGAGTYAAGAVPGTVLASEDANNACGWTLAVVYGNASLHQRNLSLFVGNSFATAGGAAPKPASVVGFCAPPSGAVNARLFVSAVEGDPNKTGDQMLFGPATNSLKQLSGTNNAANNFFGGQINGDNGQLDTSGTFGLSNSVAPAVGFCARQGWDITSVDVSAGLTNGLTSAYAQNITQGDGYSVNALALQIDVGSPVLASTQSVDKGSTYVGDTLTYTVTVTNSGTADAVNLVFTDPLAFGTSFVTGSFATNGVPAAGANPVNGVVIPLVRQNSRLVITYQAHVDQIPPSATFVTSASLNFQYSGACAQSPVINGVVVNATVKTLAPLLNVSKLASLTNVIPGALLTYTINVPNVGTTNTSGSTLIDPIPAGVTYVANTTKLNGTNVPDLGGTNMPYTVAREIHGPGSLPGVIQVGETAVVSFQVKISNNPPERLHNNATIYAYGIAPTSQQNAGATISPVYCNLAAGITGGSSPIVAGTLVNYIVAITNKGPDSLDLVTNFITLSLPLSAQFLSPVFTPSAGAYDPLTGVWSGITLASNGVITLTISGRVAGSAADSLISAVTVAPPPGVLDIATNDNSAVASNAVVQVADLSVALDDGVTIDYPGDTPTWVITAVNLGPSTLGSINLSNVFSPWLTNLTFVPSEGSFNPANGVWNGLNLPAGAGVTLSVQATLAAAASGWLTNIVTALVPPGVTDPSSANNSATDIDQVMAMPDLALIQTGPTNVYSATNFSYTFTLTNCTLGIASNVVVSDVLPTNLTFVSADGNGTNAGGVVNWTIGALAANATASLTLNVTAPLSGSITNVAAVKASTPDLNPANNTSAVLVTGVTAPVYSPLILTGYHVLSDGTLQFSFTNNPAATFTVLTATNLLLPMSNWVPAGAAVNIGSNWFQYSTLPLTNDPQRYFRVSSP